MEINTKLSGDLLTLKTKRYKETKTCVANVEFVTKVTKDDAVAALGEEFHRIAFATMQTDEDGNANFPFEKLTKPRLKCPEHVLKILGKKTQVIPEVPEIIANGKESAVIVKFVFPLLCNAETAALVGEIAASTGEVVTLELKARQMALPGMSVRKQKGGKFGNPKPVEA